MPETLTLPVQKTVVETELATPSTMQLALEFGTPTQAGRCVVILGVRTPEHEWRSDVNAMRLEIADRMDQPGDNPENRLATGLNNLILDAIIPDTPLSQVLGFAGMTVREMGAAVIEQILEGQQQAQQEA